MSGPTHRRLYRLWPTSGILCATQKRLLQKILYGKKNTFLSYVNFYLLSGHTQKVTFQCFVENLKLFPCKNINYNREIMSSPCAGKPWLSLGKTFVKCSTSFFARDKFHKLQKSVRVYILHHFVPLQTTTSGTSNELFHITLQVRFWIIIIPVHTSITLPTSVLNKESPYNTRILEFCFTILGKAPTCLYLFSESGKAPRK